MATEEQTASNSTSLFIGPPSGADLRDRQGQKLTISDRKVSKLAFTLIRAGTVSGDISFTFRKASSPYTVLGTKVLGDAGAISTSATQYEVTFDSAVTINEEARMTVDWPNASYASGNTLSLIVQKTDIKASEVFCKYQLSSWIDSSLWDATYKYTYHTKPTVTTQACTNTIAQKSTGHGNLTSIGESVVTQHGHCWNTSSNPTTSNSKAENGAAPNLGQFQSSITDLIPGTKYYVRAYATNTGGTSYGDNVEIAGDVTTIGKRYWWVGEDGAFHWFTPWGTKMKAEGVPDTTTLPWWYYT